MKVVFECDDPELYDCIKCAFLNAKLADVCDMAKLEISENSAVYTTCRGNKWFIKRDEKVLFGYEGTRSGAVALMPFRNLDNYALYWDVLDHENPVLAIVLEWQNVSVQEGDNEIETRRIPKVIKRFKVSLMEYVTSTPPEWELAWYDQVQRIPGDTKAVVMRGKYPLRIVDYKDVYHPPVTL